MASRENNPRLTEHGVVFQVSIGGSEHQCVISREALESLSDMKDVDVSDADSLDVFHAFETTIRSTAKTLADAEPAQPILEIKPSIFRLHPEGRPAAP
ncbi:DUF1488 family protein [Noviherbaspirillum galbum]|uniref:DUF1488 domain-containing protein n=1 Tax=Noviherbaspirillum galbum TaxID=2709383 RepID=A0A6B3SXL9_9BURK|nr:DUF1488 family protein [Noviherbaspirillum galbum]NEX63906.1 DUF1488 domain-containing protein [Noviherbaspirillum galbum]